MSEQTQSSVLEKIGRNVVNFQIFEGMIKELASNPNYRGTLEEIKKQHNRHFASLKNKSLGLAVQHFFQEIYVEEPLEEAVSGDQEITLRIESPDRDRLLKDIAQIVQERNDLIHTKLLHFDIGNEAQSAELIEFLDQQNQRLVPVLEHVSKLINSIRSLRSDLVELLDQELENRES